MFVLALWLHDREYFRGWSLAGEVGFLLAALLYAISQFLYYMPDDTIEEAKYGALVQAIVQFVGVTVYLVDALIYYKAYLQWRKVGRRLSTAGLMWEVDFWAEIFNILPSLGYFFTGIYQLARTVSILEQSIASLPRFLMAIDDMNRTALTINIIFDCGYVLDAILYCAAWGREAHYANLRPVKAVTTPHATANVQHTHTGAKPALDPDQQRDILDF